MFSFKLKLLLAAAFWVCSADPTTLEEKQSIHKQCQEEYGISDEVFAEMRETEMILEDESDIKKKCTIECLLLGYGMIKDGQLDVTSVLDFAKPMLEHIQQEGGEIDEEDLKVNISKCSDTGYCNESYYSMLWSPDVSSVHNSRYWGPPVSGIHKCVYQKFLSIVSGEEENCSSSYGTWVCLHGVMSKLMVGTKKTGVNPVSPPRDCY